MNVEFLVLILAVVSFTAGSKGLRCGPLERIVRDRFGNIYCKACKPCPAGEETTPPCNIDQLYDEDSLINERCKVCDDGYFKEVTERERYNTNRCLRCNTCGNHIVESPCNKTHGEICGKKCKHGYVDSGFGTCISSSKSEPPVITSNPSINPEATQKPTTTKIVEDPTKEKTTDSQQSNVGITSGHRKCKSCVLSEVAAIVLGIGYLLLLCFIVWKKIKQRNMLQNPNNGNNNHQNDAASSVSGQTTRNPAAIGNGGAPAHPAPIGNGGAPAHQEPIYPPPDEFAHHFENGGESIPLFEMHAPQGSQGYDPTFVMPGPAEHDDGLLTGAYQPTETVNGAQGLEVQRSNASNMANRYCLQSGDEVYV